MAEASACSQPCEEDSPMLPELIVPAGLLEVLQACRAAFTAPTFDTFITLVCGYLGACAGRKLGRAA
jgi:hypothetical protein